MLSLRTNVSLAIVAWLALTGAPARADDLLVMPYACSVIDGQPVLRRSRDEGHRVIGRREQRNVTTCSTVNPGMCRQWTVYRFDLDCDGARVPWLSIVAEAARNSRRNERAWVEDGRLRIDMGPRWGMSPDDPCVRGFARDSYSSYDDRWRGGRLQRYCADRQALGDASIVDMPPGFAPMLGIDGIFVGGGAPATASAPSAAPPAGASEPSFKGAGSDNPWAPEPTQKSARVEGYPPAPPETAAKSARAEPAPPPPPEAGNKSTRTEAPASPPVPPEPAAKNARFPNLPANLPPGTPVPAKSATSQEAAVAPRAAPPAEPKPAEVKPAPPPAQASTPAAAPSGPIVPKIINRPAPPSESATSQPAPVTVVPKAAATPEPGPKLAAIPPPPPKDAVVRDKPAQTVALKKDDAVPVTIFSVMPSPAVGATIVVGLLAVLLLAAFALTRRREQVRLAGRPPRDIATVSLDGRAGSAQVPVVVREDDEQIWAQAAQASPEPAPASAEKPSTPLNWGDRIPRTRDEALQVLGMGVTPDANLAAIKKIVDGLLAGWHPDHASGQGDRQMRELRMKQINAAWEIIAGKRAAV